MAQGLVSRSMCHPHRCVLRDEVSYWGLRLMVPGLPASKAIHCVRARVGASGWRATWNACERAYQLSGWRRSPNFPLSGILLPGWIPAGRHRPSSPPPRLGPSLLPDPLTHLYPPLSPYRTERAQLSPLAAVDWPGNYWPACCGGVL